MPTQDYPKRYFLFSVTMMVDGIRRFADMPIVAHRYRFPSKFELFNCLCEMFELETHTLEYLNTFAVVNIYEFKYAEEYEQYILNNIAEAVKGDETKDSEEVHAKKHTKELLN